MKCRFCENKLNYTFIDLGFAPLSNGYLNKCDLNKPERYYPLKVNVCDQCWLVQTEDYSKPDELFKADYAYFSSTSLGWLTHAKLYTENIIEMMGLNKNSFVIEIASNDGYLLKNFLKADIPCLGIEPTDSTATYSENLGVKVVREFFSEELGKRLSLEGKQADLIIGNNVYAHVPEILNFTKGLKAALKLNGIINLEFPHLLKLLENTQFDTVYHEHFSYLSLYTVIKIFEAAGLKVWHVEQLSTHGGSLRIYGCHINANYQKQESINKVLMIEKEFGLKTIKTYLNFQNRANKIKDELLLFLIEQKKQNKKIAGYGAAAKGNTLLNYAGVKPDLLPLIFDAALAKQGKYMPGSHIPIIAPSEIENYNIDYLLILPWNISDEVQKQNYKLKIKGVRFVTLVPQIEIK
jgi:hypothetical protein